MNRPLSRLSSAAASSVFVRPEAASRQAPLPGLAPTQAEESASLQAADVQERLAHEIGREYARHGMVPPLPHLLPGHPVREGWQQGRHAFAGKRLTATPAVRLALKLRLQAWASGRSFETLELTPRYLQQLDVTHCPVTREPLSGALDLKGEVAGLNRGAAFAGGHLALLSDRAAHALATLPKSREAEDWRSALCHAEEAARPHPQNSHTTHPAALSSDAWARLATLLSFVTPLAHEEAARLPLRALPPARVRLLNPIQGLQALITLQLLQADWRSRMALLAEHIGRVNPGALQHFHIVFHTLLARALEGGRPAHAQALRERLEDSWAQPHLLRRWQTFALALTPDQAETLERQAALIGQGRTKVRHHPSASQATEGWELQVKPTR